MTCDSDARRFVAIGGNDRQGADPLAIQRKRFGERARDKQRTGRRGEAADDRTVGVDAGAESLVGNVEKRKQRPRAHDFDDSTPLLVVGVDAGRVVAAGMQYDDRSRGQLLQRGDHAVDVQPVRRGLVIRIDIDDEPGAFEQRAMVFPRRVADPYLRAGREPAQKIGADLERTGAAERLNGDDATGLHELGLGSEDQAAHRAVVGGDAVDRQIDVRPALVGECALGPVHALEQRHLAVVVAINADAEVHLARVRIGIERFRDTEDRIARRHFYRG